MNQQVNTDSNAQLKTNNDLAKKVESLETALSDLKKKTKDAWDKVQILSAFLVPVSIAFAGFIFSQSTKEAEIKIAETNAKVAQAQLVHSFMDALTSPEPQKRKIAIDAVLLALPEDGTHLVRTVKEFDPDAGVRAFASQKLGIFDLYAQVVFGFNSYDEEGPSIPPAAIFAESAQLEIVLKSASDTLSTSRGWLNGRMLKNPEAILISKHQHVDRQIDATVDGVIVTQINAFERFEGELRSFSDPKAWDGATIESIFRTTPPFDEWLRKAKHITVKEFDEFYGIPKGTREVWADYQVVPVVRARLEIFLGITKVAVLSGIVARVWEHDEDVRNLHVARFVRWKDKEPISPK